MKQNNENEKNNLMTKSRFKTKEMTFIGLMGALMFSLSFIFGGILNLLTGNPAASGFITQIIQGALLTFGILTVRKYGTGSYMWLIYGILAIPTNMWGGLPGPYKVVMALISGLALDTVIYFFRYRRYSLILGGAVSYAITIPLIIYFYLELDIPGAEMVLKYWPIMFLIFFVEFIVGFFIGIKLLNKFKNKSIVKFIRNDK